MGLSDEERYNFIRSVGHKYPDDERDRIVEKLMRSERRDFESVNNELCRINLDFDLKAKSRKGKTKDKPKEKVWTFTRRDNSPAGIVVSVQDF